VKTFLTLLRREWWEHRGGFLWAPAALLGVIVLIALLPLLGADVRLSFSIERHTGEHVERAAGELEGGVLALFDVSGWPDSEAAARSERIRYLLARPFMLLHLLVAGFVLLGALHDERRDRSVLFYRSLPVSDTQTVLSKLVLAVWVAPLITIAAILIAQIALLSTFSISAWLRGAAGIGAAWQQAGLGGAAVEMLTGYLLQGLWALPVYAWLLLVSAAVPWAPAVWALLAPLLLVVLEFVLLDSGGLFRAISEHLSLRALPRPGPWFGGAGGGIGLSEQRALLFDPQLWLGMVVGAAFLAGAVACRRRNADL
jgi:ABC-2 type transport system permease protein